MNRSHGSSVAQGVSCRAYSPYVANRGLVCSLFGVILIARPASLFGRVAELPDVTLSDGTGNLVEDISLTPHVTSAQRLGAVGYVSHQATRYVLTPRAALHYLAS